jgi:hypothetical protein
MYELMDIYTDYIIFSILDDSRVAPGIYVYVYVYIYIYACRNGMYMCICIYIYIHIHIEMVFSILDSSIYICTYR